MNTKAPSIKKFEKPLGMRDTFPSIYEQTEKIRSIGRNILGQHGYQFVKTSALEYYDTVGRASAISEKSLFKLVDSQGNTLVLRPDMTTPIARLATSKLLQEKMPQRLAYFESVFRAQQQEGGRPAQFDQMGVELIGDQSYFADAEIISVCIEVLKALGIEQFQLTIGHAGLLGRILKDYTENEEQAALLNELLVERNFVGFEERVKSFDLPKTKEDALLAFMNEALNMTDIKRIEQFIRNNEDLSYLQQLLSSLEDAELGAYIAVDFTLASHMSYYTGMLFEVFASGSGFSLGNGGRYDGLLHYFGKEVGATGFSLRVDRLLEVLQETERKQEDLLLLFDKESFKDALGKARELRREGRAVTMQLAEEVEQMAEYRLQYKEVYVMERKGDASK